jgi:hypothetical protein
VVRKQAARTARHCEWRVRVLSMAARATRCYRIEEPQTAGPAVCATGLCWDAGSVKGRRMAAAALKPRERRQNLARRPTGGECSPSSTPPPPPGGGKGNRREWGPLEPGLRRCEEIFGNT